MKRLLLGDVCQQVRESIRPGDAQDMPYIGLESIESGTGEFVVGGLKTPEAPLATSFLFSDEHVLYGKLRPYLNKVAVPNFSGKCSTEIIPLAPSPEVDRYYLAYFLRSAGVLNAINARVAGSRMPRADMKCLLSLPFPYLPLPEQRRIVDILSRAEGIVRLRREAEKKVAELIPALFIEMFGDPAANPKGWPVSTIGDLCRVETGATPSRDIPAYYINGSIPWVKTGEVIGDLIFDSEELITQRAVAESNCKVFPAGTILVAMYGQGQTRGRVSMLAMAAATNQACAAILPSESIDQKFLMTLLKTQYQSIRAMGRGGNQANLNLSMIKQFQIYTPPRSQQALFVQRLEAIRALQAQQAAATTKAQASFDALLAQAFPA